MKVLWNYLLYVFVLSSLLFVTGCSSHTTSLTPNYPLDTHIVDTLEPDISWNSTNKSGAKYDIVVYEKLDNGDTQAYGGSEAGRKEVFYKEGVEGTNIKLQDVFEPGKTYMWSVRERNGDTVSEWSLNQTQVFTGVSYHLRTKLFEFRTPNEK